MIRRIVVLGALSDIATASCRLHAGRGDHLVIVGRDAERLEALAADLRVRGAGHVEPIACDLADAAAPDRLAGWVERLGGVDLVLLAYGVLGDQRAMELDLAAAARLIDTNFRSAALWCLAAAAVLERRKGGTLAVIGSVAGDRGRQSNALYGATKAGLATLVEGLAHRLAPAGAHALLIKPGFVDTAMTAHIAAKGALWATPQQIARIIDGAVARRRAVTYAPGFWRPIMFVIRAIPRAIFHRTKL